MTSGGPVQDARSLLAEAIYSLGRAEHHEGGSPVAVIDFVLAPDDDVTIEWSGQLRPVKARRVDYGDDGQPRGLRITGLTAVEQAAADHQPASQRGTGDGRVSLIDPGRPEPCTSCGKDAALRFTDSATGTEQAACLEHTADIAYDVAVVSAVPEGRAQ
jgi:hypothetical protein